MVLALTLSLLGATPEYSVIVARRIGIDEKKGTELAELLADQLERQSRHPLGALLPVKDANAQLAKAGFPDTAVCNGASACVATLARACGFKRLVSLQLVKIGSDVAVDASVIEGEGKSVAAVTKTIRLKNAGDELLAIAGELILELPEGSSTPPVAAKLPETKPDAPKVVALTPHVEEPPLVVAPALPPGLSTGRKVALGLGGAAVAALAVGIGLGVSAMGQSSTLSVKDAEYAARVSAVKQTALGADLSYGAAGALAIGAGVAWLVSE